MNKTLLTLLSTLIICTIAIVVWTGVEQWIIAQHIAGSLLFVESLTLCIVLEKGVN